MSKRNYRVRMPSSPGSMNVRAVGLMAVGVVAVSMSGPIMASLAVPALVIAFWRNGLATALIAPFALTRQRNELVSADRSKLGWFVLSGLFLAVHFGFWVTSLRMTSVASSTAIVSLQVIWVVAWDRLRGTRLPAKAILGVAVAVAGALAVSGVDLETSGRALAGDGFALVASVAVAAYTVIGGHARRRTSTTTYTFVVYGTAAVVLLVAALLAGQRPVGYDARAWALIGLVTLTSQLLGHSVFNHLLATTTPMLVSLAILLEIPGASLLAAALLRQVPRPAALLGLLLILSGMVLVIVNRTPTADGVPLS